MMEVIGVLEEELSIRISDKEVSTLNNVGDLLNLVRDRIPGQLPEPPKAPDAIPAKARGPECWDIAAFPEVRNIGERLEEIERNGLRNPYFHVHDGTARNRSVIDGVEMLNFSSYNYLGFSGHPEVIAAAKEAIERYGTSVSASRPVSGERQIHRDLEQGLAGHIGVEDAIAFVSGHATNVTTIGHLFDKNDLILHDSLCHDSILQGIYLSGAKRIPFRHADHVRA